MLAASTLSLAVVGGAATAVLPPDSAAAVDDATNSSELGAAADDALGKLEQANSTRRPAHFRQYLAARNAIAERAADALGIDRQALGMAWADSDLAHQTAVLAAISQLGVPYQTHAAVEGSAFDCSGLTSYAWGRAGHQLEHQSARQLDMSAPRELEHAQPGDLAEYPGHVMMYLGVGDAIIHAPHSGKTVELSTIASGRSVRVGDPTG